jgi:hypothetical protein
MRTGMSVFISYRRNDIAAVAGRVSDRLAQEFGRDSLRFDPFGRQFRQGARG